MKKDYYSSETQITVKNYDMPRKDDTQDLREMIHFLYNSQNA